MNDVLLRKNIEWGLFKSYFEQDLNGGIDYRTLNYFKKVLEFQTFPSKKILRVAKWYVYENER